MSLRAINPDAQGQVLFSLSCVFVAHKPCLVPVRAAPVPAWLNAPVESADHIAVAVYRQWIGWKMVIHRSPKQRLWGCLTVLVYYEQLRDHRAYVPGMLL